MRIVKIHIQMSLDFVALTMDAERIEHNYF